MSDLSLPCRVSGPVQQWIGGFGYLNAGTSPREPE